MLGPLLIISCAFLWATDAIFRLPLANSIDSSTIVLLEHVICLLATLPLFLLRRKETRALGWKGRLAMVFIGIVGSAGATIAFTASYRFVNPSVTILLQKLQPIITVVAARVLLAEKPKAGFYGWALLAILAGVMVAFPQLERPSELAGMFSGMQSKGVALALAAAFGWGLSTVFGKWVTHKVSFPVTTFLRFLWGLLGLGVFMLLKTWDAKLPLSNLYFFFSSDPSAVRAILYMSLVPGVAAMYLYYAGLKRTRASVATFCEMFFPVAAVLINWQILGKGLAALQIVGAVLLLIAVAFITRRQGAS